MKTNSLSFLRAAGWVAGAVLLLGASQAAETDALPTFDTNYIKLAAWDTSLSGSKAAYQARTQNAKRGTAGIESFDYGYDLSKDTNLTVDGKALFDQEDYLLSFKVTKNEVGSFEAGYKRFRTFYDGAGGFFPLNNAWLPTYPRALFVDRGNFFVNATIALPKAPVFTFKYSNQTRNGQKDSTMWGDSDLTGLTATAARKILPNIYTLGERQETWEASVRDTVGNTTAVLTVAGDRINNLDSRTVDRNVGELRAFGTIPATPSTLPLPTLATNQTRGSDIQGFKENGLSVGGRIETVVNDQVTVFAALNYHHATESITASRLITASIATATGIQNLIAGYTAGGRPAYSYTSNGHLKEDILTGNLGVQTKPMPDLNVEFALKGEEFKTSGTNQGTYFANMVVLATGAVTPITVDAPQSVKNNEKPWTPAIDVRYTGVKSLALYGDWDYRSTTQDERTSYGAFNVSTSGATAGQLSGSINPGDDHIKEKHSNFKVGANWTPLGMFSGRAEFFTKDHQNRFNSVLDTGYYILDYDIYGAKLSAVVKPLPVLSFTTRYIIQRGKATVSDDATGKGDSGDSRRYTLGETIDWNPTRAFYMQGNANLVYDTIVTSYPRVTGAATQVVQNSDNNYWDGNVIAGIVVNKETDVQLEATYYKSNNYNPAYAYTTLPYGASSRDYTVTAGVKYKFDAKTLATAKVGYLESKNDTTGGNANYRGPLAYVAIERAF